MNTKINMAYKGVNYVLEYDRSSVKLLEANGFELEQFLKKPMSNIELAFTGAFVKNHRNVKQTTIDEIFKHCKNKKALVETLTDMISDTYNSLLEEPDEDSGDEGNATWDVIDYSNKKNQE